MRRTLLACAVAVTMVAAVAALRWHPLSTVFATPMQAGLQLQSAAAVGGGPLLPGCPGGPFFTFCDQAPGTTSAAVQFTVLATVQVQSVAVAPAPVPGLSSNFASADFTVTNNTCTETINAGATCTVDVAFSPTTRGFRAAEIAVSDSAGDMLAIKVDGTGANLALAPAASPPVCGASATVQENAFTYCNQTVGTPSVAQTFIVNAGVAVNNIKISLAAIPGLTSEFASGDFASSNNCGSLGAGGNCSVTVAFSPTVVGLRSTALTATATDASSATTYSTTVYLAGTGIGSGTTMPGLQFTAPTVTPTATCPSISAFEFCNEPNGGTSATITYTVLNNSGTQVTGLTITPPVPTTPPPQGQAANDFTPLATTCSPTLGAGLSCTINVAFTPLGTGLRQGAVTVTDAQGDVAAINLAGFGDDYSMSLASGQPPETTIKQGDTATFMAQVTPDNVFGANGEMVQFACPKANQMPGFSTCAFNPCPVSVTPGTSVAFNFVVVTSSATKTAPPVTNPCMAAAASGAANREPRLATLYVTLKTPGGTSPSGAARFPAPMALGLLGIAMLAAARRFTPRRMAGRTPSMLAGHDISCRHERQARLRAPLRLLFAAAAIAALIFAGCHKGAAPTDVTPIGTYPLTITGNALDANGNPLNASHSVTFMLDVIQGK